ncbi:hypothetical protein RchiOBHm_Chr5g0072481 [Rosa chinensis]|uniref:Uncharacterized protein n=1 Tax=Rosa chinensis TaxID=74649 RepID=A0A2P6QKN5_ROSCH|nr:hypothetical protein RchiOBHm_Chr5g0072481 [Rosa chinensis]
MLTWAALPNQEWRVSLSVQHVPFLCVCVSSVLSPPLPLHSLSSSATFLESLSPFLNPSLPGLKPESTSLPPLLLKELELAFPLKFGPLLPEISSSFIALSPNLLSNLLYILRFLVNVDGLELGNRLRFDLPKRSLELELPRLILAGKESSNENGGTVTGIRPPPSDSSPRPPPPRVGSVLIELKRRRNEVWGWSSWLG